MSVRPRHDRWLISYADFVTLLFAVFVVLYATEKMKEHSETKPEVHQTAPLHSNLITDLEDSLKIDRTNRALMISADPRGVLIAVDERRCFAPGDSDIQTSAFEMFQRIGGTLARYPNKIVLVGHTDSTPIHNGRFRSNWELSTARSISVMQMMERAAHLSESRFLIQGSADNAPVSNENTDEGKAQNRRVDILILD